MAIRHPGELRWETRLLAMLVATLAVFGVIEVYGASSLTMTRGHYVDYAYAARQLSGLVVGGLLLMAASRIDYYVWRRLAWPLLLLTIVLLLVLLLPGLGALRVERNGATRWLALGPATFQPSELARFTVVVWAAMLAAKKGTQIRELKKGVLPFVVILGAIGGLILLQPSMSMAVLVVALGGLVLFTAGARISHLFLTVLPALMVAAVAIAISPYRLVRLMSFLHPETAGDAGFQVRQSLIGFGSGQLFGVGLGQGSQKLGFLPYAESDFVFSHIGEEWGFLGVALLVGLYALFCWLGLRIARTAAEPFGQFLAIGLTATVGVTAIMHMAVNVSLWPPTGITLPFVSYGRSSLVMSLLAAGILLNIGRMRGRLRPVQGRREREANARLARRA